MSEDPYDRELLGKLINYERWPFLDLSEGFNNISARIQDELPANTLSGQIASIFVWHQIGHEMTKSLIKLCLFYVQGEIWPTKFNPKFDGGKDKHTEWYLQYLQDNCMEFTGKLEYLESIRELNRLRNAIAHKLTEKNESIVEQTYLRSNALYESIVTKFTLSNRDLNSRLIDLTKRVDFKTLGEESEDRL